MTRKPFFAALIALLLVFAFAGAASAHALRIFARVEGSTISGYAFFIGGGRAMNTPWRITRENGDLVGEGHTDSEGNFSTEIAGPIESDITVTVDTQEGHIAKAVLPPERFGAAAPLTEPADETKAPPAPRPVTESRPTDTSEIERAVARQVAPLLERIEQMDARLRLADIMSGIFLIIGLAGIALWARGRRK